MRKTIFDDSPKITGTVDERIESFEKLGIPYVSFEYTKPDGNKMHVVIRTDKPEGKKIIGKKAFSKLFK